MWRQAFAQEGSDIKQKIGADYLNFLNWNTEGLLSKSEDVEFIVYVHILF